MEKILDIQVRRTDDAAVLDLSGEIDALSSPDLKQVISELLTSGEPRILVNLSQVEYIDSFGLGTLVGGLRRARDANGDLSIVGASPRVRKVLNVTGLAEIFDMPSDDSAGASDM